MKALKLMAVALLVGQLSGCFFTKIATVPMRLVGAGIEVVGAVVSVVPGVGNAMDATLETFDLAIDKTADSMDALPL